MLGAQTQRRGDAPVWAPDFAGATEWLNINRPLSIHELAGQVVLLDFWTYCCINCMHVLPDLKYLEEKYRDRPFVVIGVHSGKFSQEKDPENIRRAIRRHNVSHPVAVDSDYKIWNSYSVRAWPTLVLIDPEGYVVGTLSGEGHRQTLDRAIARLLEEHRRKGTLGAPLKLTRGPEESGPAGQKRRAQLAVGPSAGRRRSVHRHGRDAPGLGLRPEVGARAGFRRHRPGRGAGRAPRAGHLCSAVRTDLGR